MIRMSKRLNGVIRFPSVEELWKNCGRTAEELRKNCGRTAEELRKNCGRIR